LLRQIAFSEPRPLRKRNVAVPRELETIVLKALSKDPSGRFATAQDCGRRLAAARGAGHQGETHALGQRRPKWAAAHGGCLFAARAFVLRHRPLGRISPDRSRAADRRRLPRASGGGIMSSGSSSSPRDPGRRQHRPG
jgi:hypothetical protein